MWQDGMHGSLFKSHDGKTEVFITFEAALDGIKSVYGMLANNADIIIQFIMDTLSIARTSAVEVYNKVYNKGATDK